MKKPLKLKIKDYKFLNVLSNYINASNATVKFPFILGIVFVFLCIGIYGAVRLFGYVDVRVYMIFPIIINNCLLIMSLILLSSAQLHKLSADNLELIKHSIAIIPSRALRMEVKCIHSFGVRAGMVGAFKYSHVAQFFLALSNASLSLLVAFPNANLKQ
jgi:hypothetical protein